MPIVDDRFRQEYLKRHPDHYGRVELWMLLASYLDDANRISYAYEDWLVTNHKAPPPDLVEWFAWYGYVRLRLKNWELPIQLSEVEQEEWRQAGYYVTLQDFRKALAGVVGGVAVVAGKHPNRTIKIIQRQLDEKLAELNRLADLPLEYYTPRNQEWQLREDFKKRFGLSGDALEEAVMDEMAESAHDYQEVPRFEAPFVLRQQLESFEWAMECLRLIVMGEVNPKLGLPNQELFMALMQVNLNSLKADLADVDKKLRRIWDHLAGYRCTCLNADYEPQKFWWRHYKLRTAGKPAR